MFGSSAGGGGFGGFGQPNNQNTTGGFGATTNTGGGFGTFGQPQQQQQQQPAQNQTTGFGSTGFGAANTQQSTGFGSTGFGQNTASTFGQPKPFGSTPTTTSGGGLFGTTNTATSGGFGGFGATNNAATTNTGFGTPAASAGGLFGAKPATTGFGSTTTGGLFGGGGTTASTGFGASATTTPAAGGFGATPGALQAPINGTSNPAFEPYIEKDVATNAMNHFQTIAFMPAYQKFSLEELRLQDYAQNRKMASGPAAGGFGATGGFGTFGQTQPQTTGFGQTQPAAAAGGLFGASGTSTTAFGQTPASTGFGATATTAGGLFGQNKPATGGLFGNSTASTTTPSTGGLFGNAGSGFGASNTATGGFGQTASSGTGLFGQNNNQAKPATGFSFGNTAATGTGFGQQAQQSTSTGFGQPAAPATGTGLFGQQQQQATTGFGQSAAAAATSSPFGGFGATQAQPQNTGFGTGFGTQNTQTPNKPFGGFGSTTPAAAPSGGLFGNTQQNTQTNTGGGLFGNKFGTPATGTGTGLFGNSTAAPAPTSIGLFGASATPSTGTGLFGNQNQNQASTGLFGNSAAKPATGGLFGAAPTNNTGGGLFGNMNNNNNNNTQGNSLFGQQNNNQNNTGMNNGSMFGNNQGFMGNNSMQGNNQMQQPTSLNSSLMDQRPYGNLLLDMSQMSNASPGPIATPLSASTQKKKNAMIPHHKIAPRQPALTPRLSQPFSRSVSPFASANQMGGSLGRSFSGNSSRLGLGSSMFDATGDESVLQSSAFSPSNANRSANLKKLVIDRKLRDTDLFSNSSDVKTITDSPANQTRNPLKKTVSFDTSSISRQSDTSSHTPNKPLRNDNRTSPNNEFGFLRSSTRKPVEDVQSNNNVSTPPSLSPETPPAQEIQATPEKEEVQVNAEGLKHGEYWMVPTAAKLGTIPRDKLSSVPSLKVGRRGYGQISFDQPVDLTGLNSLDEVCGGVITFGDRVCTVYPPGWTKPAPGNGLNVPATITLEDCFPTDRENKKPIRDVDHPRYQFHLKRLKSVPDTEFIDYLVQEGIWVFKVKHFTAYGLFDENDEMDEDDVQGKTPTSTSTYSEIDDTIHSRTDESREDSFYSEDASYDENVEDTFDFKRNPDLRSSQMQSDSDMYEDDAEADITIDESPMLPSEEDSAAESSDTASEGDLTEIMSPHNEAVTIRDDEGQLMLADISQLSSRSATPEPKLGLGKDWTEQLGQTISPVKRTVRFANGTPSKKSLNLTGPLDLAQEFFVAEGDFESPYRASVQHSPLSNKKRYVNNNTSNVRPYDERSEPADEKAAKKAVRPTWGPHGELFYLGSIEGGRPRGFGDVRASGLSKTKLSFAAKPSCAQTQLELQLAATTFSKDPNGVPSAQLDRDLTFSQFAELSLGDKLNQIHEAQTWKLASILFDDVDDKSVPATDLFMRLYYRDRIRKDELSNFIEQLVLADVEKDVRAATTPEEVAVAYLSGHRIEDACSVLLEGGDYRLASVLPLIGGDTRTREEMKRQLAKWRQDGVLAEISIPIRAMYELLAGNTNYSEGVKFPMEDVTPTFYISERFGLDWKRTFGLRLWYDIFEDEKLEEAVRRYTRDLERADSGKNLQKPIPWYQEPGVDHSKLAHQKDPNFTPTDILWELLSLHSKDSMTLENVLHPRNISASPIDYRVSWQLKSMFVEKQVREFADPAVAEQLTVDFAWQLELQGQWEWAIFVLLHLRDAKCRETAIRQLLGRQISSDKEPNTTKLDFIQKKLLIPSNWIFESKALAARNAHKHFTEVENLLSASSWNEAHKTLVRHVAPICVVNCNLPRLHEMLSKFTNVELVDNWTKGGQVYLDYISLMAMVDQQKGNIRESFTPTVPKSVGLPKTNTKKDVTRRLLDALPKMEKKEFLQGVAISEIAKILGGFVLKNDDLAPDAPKVMKLPMNEDQFLHKTLALTYNMYKTKLGIK